MDFNQLDTVNISIDTVVMMAFYFLIGAYVIYSGVLYYHWKNYSSNIQITNLTLILYFITTLPLIIAMGIIILLIF